VIVLHVFNPDIPEYSIYEIGLILSKEVMELLDQDVFTFLRCLMKQGQMLPIFQ
jgi:hypothetical protein